MPLHLAAAGSAQWRGGRSLRAAATAALPKLARPAGRELEQSGAALALTFYFVMRLYASFFFTLPLLVGGALKAQVHYYLGASLPCLLLIFCQSSLLHCCELLPHSCQKLVNLFLESKF